MPRLLPNWIDAYLAYTAESESPETYHLWIALSTIAGVLRRKVFFDMGYFLLYPNLYIVLVGPPGRCKKSTAMRIGRSIGVEVPGIEFSVDSTTRERLILDMSQAYKDDQSAINVHSTEFASLLSNSGMEMVVFLTDIFDCPPEWTHRTKGGGTNKIKAPFLNFVGAVTPEWLAKGLPTDVIGFGFTSRIVFVYQDTPRVVDPFPQLTDAQQELKKLLVHDLNQMSLVSGQYQYNSEAKEMYRAWAQAHQSRGPGNPKLEGYMERKPMHVIKLTMILAASKRDDLILTEEDHIQALDLLEHVESDMPRVFSAVGRNPLYADQEAMLGLIMSDKGFTMAELMGQFGHNLRKDELMEVIDSLVMEGRIILSQGKYYANRKS